MFLWLSSCALMVDGVIHLPYRHHSRKRPPTAEQNSVLPASTRYEGLANSEYDVLVTFNSSSGYTAEFPVVLDTGSQPFNVLGHLYVVNGSTFSYYQGDCYTDSYMVDNYGSGGSNGSVCVNGSASVGLGELSAEPISSAKIFYAVDLSHSCSLLRRTVECWALVLATVPPIQIQLLIARGVALKWTTVWVRFPFLIGFSGSTACQTFLA